MSKAVMVRLKTVPTDWRRSISKKDIVKLGEISPTVVSKRKVSVEE